jgi:hypothetical protein
VAANWGLAGGGNNALAMFGVGAQMGQNLVDRREQREQKNALLAQRQQQIDLQTRQQEQQAQQQQEQERRADLPMLGKLLDYAQDEPTYQQARQVAQQYGIDVTGIPETFGDGAWVTQQRQIVGMMQTPQGQEALSTAGKQAQDAGYRPGTPEFTGAVRQIITAGMAQPYTGAQGETRLYTPNVFGGGGQVQGAQPYDPNEWEVVEEGGPASQAPAGFRP